MHGIFFHIYLKVTGNRRHGVAMYRGQSETIQSGKEPLITTEDGQNRTNAELNQ